MPAAERWATEVLATIEGLAGHAARTRIEQAWATHAKREKVEITVFGPYSSGKSSIVRRLLADGGRAIPEWLTVSGRRETFELNEVELDDYTLTDTPGFAATAERHDELAEDALALSDAFLLVVPPQLLTSGRKVVADLLSGRHFFGRPQSVVESATVAVISRTDELGIDPEDNPEGVVELAARKRRELSEQLAEAAGRAISLRIFAVAADPYGEQARNTHPSRADYDATRRWDGMGELAEELRTFSGRLTELRSGAYVRYLGRVALQVHDDALAHADALEATLSEIRSRQATVEAYETQFSALLEAGRAELEAGIVETALSAANSLPPNEAGAANEFDSQLETCVRSWSARWAAKFDELMAAADVEIDRRVDRPASLGSEEFLRSLKSVHGPLPDPAPHNRILGVLNEVRSDIGAITEAGFKAKTGESLEAVLANLEKARRPGRGGRAPVAAADASKGGLGDIQRTAQGIETAAQVAGSVLEIANVLDAERRQAKIDQAMRERRERARDRVERLAQDRARDVIEGSADAPGWRALADAALTALRVQLDVGEGSETVGALTVDLERVRAALSSLEQLLDAPPSPAPTAP